jgi:acetyl-CoA acetyltransferase
MFSSIYHVYCDIFSPGIRKEDVDEVYMGNVCTAMEGQAPCRQATLGAGKISSYGGTGPCRQATLGADD